MLVPKVAAREELETSMVTGLAVVTTGLSDITEQSAAHVGLRESVETAPAETTPGHLRDGPIKYDGEFNYYFLLLGLVFLAFGGLWYWIHQRSKKRRQHMGQVTGNRDADGFENISWSWELPTYSRTCTPESKILASGAGISWGGKTDKGGMFGALKRKMTIQVTSAEAGTKFEATPWDAYDATNDSPFTGENRTMVPLRAHHQLSKEELARRHIPLAVAVVSTTCSGTTTPEKYLDPEYIHPAKTLKRCCDSDRSSEDSDKDSCFTV